MASDWQKVQFGKTGLSVSPIGIGSSYGVGARDLERAFDRGINFFFWGLRRRGDFGRGVRAIAKKNRDQTVIAIQSYTRMGSLMNWSVDRARKALDVDRIDLLCLGWWNAMPPRRILDAAQRLKEAGKIGSVMVSCHDRPQFEVLAREPLFDAIMVRYNAAHTGAEREVFPRIEGRDVGVLAFTATRWGTLLSSKLTPEGDRTPRGRDCYRFALADAHVHSTLAGPKNAVELDEALAALDEGPMSAEELVWMRRVGSAVRDAANANRVIGLVDRARNALTTKSNAPPAA